MSLSYDGNRLTAVDDTLALTYDLDGRLRSDASRGISLIKYAPNDRPVRITDVDGKSMSYEYDAAGNKLSEQQDIRLTDAGSWEIVSEPKRVYAGPFEFLIDDDGNVTLDRTDLQWGYLDSDHREQRYITDHQGNVRAVTDALGHISQATDYTPYGTPVAMSLPGSGVAAANRHLYSGKEWTAELGAYDFHARSYAPATLTFNRPDPQAAKYPHLNPYLYCAANPLRYTDPTGEDVTISIKNDTIIVTANIILHGDGAADSMVESCKESFDNTWGKISEYEKDGVKYHVKWKITIRKQQSGDAVPDKSNGVDNYMRVDTNNPHLRSRVYESRYGTFYKSKYKKLSTRTFAHEFGHMLGLKDRYSDIGGKSISHDGWHGNIMAAGKELNIDQRNLDAIFLKATHKQNWHGNKPNSTSKNPAYRTEELFNLLNQNIIITCWLN